MMDWRFAGMLRAECGAAGSADILYTVGPDHDQRPWSTDLSHAPM